MIKIKQNFKESWAILIILDLTTGASWLCYYKALQVAKASRVVSIDKLSVVITLILAFVFLNEQFMRKALYVRCYIEERTLELARHIIKNKCTVRDVLKNLVFRNQPCIQS